MWYEAISNLFGLGLSSESLGAIHLIARITFIYFSGILLFRINRQFMSIVTPFNYILNFTLGSVLAEAVTGTVPFFSVLAMILFIMFVNFAISCINYVSKPFEKFIKGWEETLVLDGKIQWHEMRKNLVTKDELIEALHLQTNCDDLSRVHKAIFENSGRISFILKDEK